MKVAEKAGQWVAHLVLTLVVGSAEMKVVMRVDWRVGEMADPLVVL